MHYFFKDSSVRRDEFHSLKELVEPNSPYIALVQYHRVRWLSFSDCVSRLVKLLPLLVRYFEEQALDTTNRQEVRTKCRSLHSRLSEPRFQLFLFFLEPQLEVLAKMSKWLQKSSLPRALQILPMFAVSMKQYLSFQHRFSAALLAMPRTCSPNYFTVEYSR